MSFNIILPDPSIKYEDKMLTLKLVKLIDRRKTVTKKFAVEMSQNPKFAYLFPKKECTSTRSKSKFIEPKCYSSRYKCSAIPNFIHILNSETWPNTYVYLCLITAQFSVTWWTMGEEVNCVNATMLIVQFICF